MYKIQEYCGTTIKVNLKSLNISVVDTGYPLEGGANIQFCQFSPTTA